MEFQNPHRIHRHSYESQFTIFSNSLWEDEHLSWSSKSLLAYMLSRPKDWIVYRSQLASIYKGEKRGNGKKAVDTCFDELIEKGYIIYTPKDQKTGQFIHRYDIFPEPFEEFQKKFPKRLKGRMASRKNGLKGGQQSNNSLPSKETYDDYVEEPGRPEKVKEAERGPSSSKDEDLLIQENSEGKAKTNEELRKKAAMLERMPPPLTTEKRLVLTRYPLQDLEKAISYLSIQKKKIDDPFTWLKLCMEKEWWRGNEEECTARTLFDSFKTAISALREKTSYKMNLTIGTNFVSFNAPQNAFTAIPEYFEEKERLQKFLNAINDAYSTKHKLIIKNQKIEVE